MLFFLADLLLVLTPGPDWVYIVTRGFGGGRRIALLSVGGVCGGYLTHTVLAALGIAALLRSSGTAFELLRYAGAVYLVYLGARMILSRNGALNTGNAVSLGSTWSVVRQGFFTSILNPKGLLLYLSLLPQFVDPDASLPVAAQLLILGCLHTANCAAIYGAVGLGAGGMGELLERRLRLACAIRWLTGSVLIGLGLRLAVPGHQ